MAYYDSNGVYQYGEEIVPSDMNGEGAGDTVTNSNDGSGATGNDNGGSVTETYNDSGTVISTTTAPGGKVQGDPSHVYVGREWRGETLYDVWQLYQAASGHVLEWSVLAGADSRSIIWSTYRDIGPPSSASVAQAPGGIYSLTPRRGDPTHYYLTTDYRGDVWQQYDSSRGIVQEWAVLPGNDSRQPIPGTLHSIGPWSASMAVPASAVVVTTVNTPTNPPPPLTPPPSTPNNPPPGSGYNGGANLPNPGRASFNSHFYVGRTTQGDFWQTFDGTNVIEWRVDFGAESGAKIAGTERNLGAWSAMTSVPKSFVDAWNAAHPKDTVQTTPGGSGGGTDTTESNKIPASSAPLVIGIIGVIVNMLK